MTSKKFPVESLSDIYNAHAQKIIDLSEISSAVDERVKSALSPQEQRFFEDTYKPLMLNYFRLSFTAATSVRDLGLGKPEIGVYTTDGGNRVDVLMKVDFIKELERGSGLEDLKKIILALGPKGLGDKLAAIEGQTIAQARDYTPSLRIGAIKPLLDF